MKKKKEIPVKEKIKRMKYILTAFVIMLVLIGIKGYQLDKEEIIEDKQEHILDTSLDSLLNLVAPQGYEITMLGEPVVIKQHLTSPYRGEMKKLEQELASISQFDNLPPEKKQKLFDQTMEEYIKYSEQVEHDERDPRMIINIDSRRIRFKTTDNKEYACFQQHFQGIHQLRWLVETTDFDPYSGQYQELLNNE